MTISERLEDNNELARRRDEGYRSVAFAVGDELENAIARIAELEARLAEAETKLADPDYMYAGSRILRESIVARNEEREEQRNRAEKAEAENKRLREALTDAEAYLSGEDGPIQTLWENCDIGDYDDYQQEWPETLADVRNPSIDPAILGSGTEWPVIDLYREVLAALSPEQLTGAQINALHPQIIQPEQPAESEDANAPI